MEKALNIRIGYGKKEVTITLVKHRDYYKVIYFGGIMGGIQHFDGEWELMDPADVEAGDLPPYTPDLKGDRLEMVLDEHTINAIGKEIEHH